MIQAILAKVCTNGIWIDHIAHMLNIYMRASSIRIGKRMDKAVS